MGVKKVWIMRGLPGSGKSTLVRQMSKGLPPGEVFVCSADDYRLGPDGEYRFRPENNRSAHDKCYWKFLSLVLLGEVPGSPRQEDDRRSFEVFVDNTNITGWEIAPYYRLAEAAGTPVTIVECVCPLPVCMERQTHAVPDVQMGRMQERLERSRLEFPPWWERTSINTDTESGKEAPRVN